VPALALVFALTTAGPDTAARPNLTGRWVLDKDRSEERKPPEGRGGRGAPGRRPREDGTQGGGPGGGRFSGGRPGADPRVLLQEILEPAQTLLITEDGTDLVIESGGERVLRLRPDGKVWKRENGTVETKAEWKGAELVAVSRMAGGGPKLTATYARAPVAREIVVTLEIDPPTGPPLTARRVYVPATD